MASSYNARKAAQVIAYLIGKSGKPTIDILKAVKLVYLCDRESLSKYGFPILDESHVSMPHGPVNSTTYRHVNGEVDLDACGWADFLQGKENYQIAATRFFSVNDLDELSDADIVCLDQVWAKFGHMTKWQIRDWTHDRRNIPEWEDPNGSSRPIPLERIMTLLGIENADEQAAVINEHRALEKLFSSMHD